MFKLAIVAVLLVLGSCLAVTFDEQEQFDENKNFDVAQAFDERQDENQVFDESQQELDDSQGFDDTAQDFDDSEDFDDDSQDFDDDSEEFDESQDFDSELDTTSEDEVVDRHVRQLDAAREALLKFARVLRKGKNITNAFLKVVDGFEKQIADFQAALGRRRVRPDLVEKLKKFIEEAAKDRRSNTLILRTLTAQGLFIAQKSEDRPRRAKRDALEDATAFLESIREDIGDVAFEEFLSVSGLVTLMFVIDDTGSMSVDIQAAIAIATQIVRHPRDYEVDYILSPFNDPDTGPITIKNETQGEEFVTALNNLTPHGGGDCPELAFKGMIDALESGPQPGSAMYVFTDAPPADATPENINQVIELAYDLLVPINIFSTVRCGSAAARQSYTRVATETGGLVYPLKTNGEIKKLGSLVSNSLGGSVSITYGGGGGSTTGRRRRATGSEYTIPADESIEKLFITVTTQNSGPDIALLDPAGKDVTEGRTTLEKGVVYEISSPVSGVYTLVVGMSAGRHTYRVNAVSSTNIDFGHYYTYIPRRGRNPVPIPIDQPLQGTPTTIFITVAGAEFIRSSSLLINVVNSDDGTIFDCQALQPVGTSGIRYIVKLDLPPPGIFKLELRGRTKKGHKFVRTSVPEDKATSVTIRLSYTPTGSYVLSSGLTTKFRFQVQRGNVGDRLVTYAVSMNDQPYGSVVTLTVKVRRGRSGFVRITFRVPADAPKGKSLSIKVYLTVVGETKPITTLSFSLLVV